MAARRLIIVMVILLGVSVALAALVPQRDTGEDTVGSTETATGTSDQAGPAAGATTDAQPDAARLPEEERGPQTARIVIDAAKFPVVPIELGEQLSLVVASKKIADQVEIPALGLIESVAPGSPARFELLPVQPGNLGVRLVGAERLVARIEVSAAARSGAREGSDRPAAKRRP
jgi:hypothetical protein